MSPATVDLTALGTTAQLSAEVRNQNGRVMAGAAVTWSSSAAAVATVSASGLVTAVANGAATITATAGGASGDALVTVTQSVDSVAVAPVADIIEVGDTVRLAAEAYDASGHAVAGASLTWSSGDPAVATVDPSGLVRGVGEGTATIAAAAGHASGTSEISVGNPDRAALVAFYHALDGPNWVDDANWLTDAPLREWHGVSTDGEGRVVRLELSGEWRAEVGSIPHGLSGEIPPELGDLPRLSKLDLGINFLRGSIPPELGGLEELRSLQLWANGLTGEIPPELGNLSSLHQLVLDGNDLTGEIPLELGDLKNMTYLGLGNNDLSGPIPPELGDLKNLETLNLRHNGLSGPIPPELGGLQRLERLELHGNQLGAFPQTFTNLRNLKYATARGGVCVPGTAAFVDWTKGWADADELAFCNASDHAALTDFYQLAAGGEWTASGGWLGGPALEEWHGVKADSLGRVTALALSDNGLSGSLPGVIADLVDLSRLRIDGNELGGRLPLSLTALDLEEFHYDGTDLCEPADGEFRRWLDGIPSHRGTEVQCAPLTDRAVLVALYESAGGPGWGNRNGWLTEAPLRLWHGVEVNAQGRVVGLGLGNNGLSGAIPPELGGLEELRSLQLWANDLTGGIPPALGELKNLETLNLRHNGLSGPIPPELGGLEELHSLILWANDLTGGIPPALGDLSSLRELNLGGNNLSGGIPPELGNLSSLHQLDLDGNVLTGEIPLELGDLKNMTYLGLRDNGLSGPIPPELGDLKNLRSLYLHLNDLSGPIPPELGGLEGLGWLFLRNNDLTGEIPPELGDLKNLRRLHLSDNGLSGPIPPELGNLKNMEYLHLHDNDLAGPIPSTFGGLRTLTELQLSHNPGLIGALPADLRNLSLESLLAAGTGLCVPREMTFEEWLATIPQRRIQSCGEPPAAYLVQAVQSRTHPVSLVAGEDALLRVFVTAEMETTEGMPAVRARFYLNGTERHVAEIPGSSTPIPTEVDEGNLATSASAVIPGRIVRPGLEMVVEIDPDGVLDASLGVPQRIPRDGRLAVDVRDMPVLDLTVIPFLWSSNPDSAIIGLAEGMAADPEGHALLEDTHVLLPVGDLVVNTHAPVASTSNDAFDLIHQTDAIRVLEGGGGHYMGMMSGDVTRALGVGYSPGRSSFSVPNAYVIAHELGHNMSLGHAPCGGAGRPDPGFPYPDGTIGAWGYDFRRGRLVSPGWRDHMSYCDPTWTSDYHFTNALRHRLDDAGAAAARHAAATVESLLLWGGVDTAGTPFLSPAFVADAPPALPDSAGDYTVTGRDASGRRLFSLDFAMSVALSEEAVSSFVFALPAQPGWAGALASVTLSGPAGTATLDGDSDMPMAILRDPRTGQVRGFLRGAPATARSSAAARGRAGAVAPMAGQALEVLFSRGIPESPAWRR